MNKGVYIMKKLLTAVAALTSLSVYAGENQSLHEFMVKNYDWKQDSSHIVHVVQDVQLLWMQGFGGYRQITGVMLNH